MAVGDPINGLLTNGLGVGLPASAMIITATTFTLGPATVIVQTPTSPVTGGSYPMPPGTANTIFRPVDAVNRAPNKHVPFYTPYNYNVKRDIVVVKLTIGETVHTKEYAIPQSKSKVIIKVLNFAEKMKSGITVKFGNIKRVAVRAFLQISKFRKRS